ncbi:MAG: ABC transporter substrate-binding protein [Methanobrevibacter sp.]|nr:ABC transporter substrate-binding protein [Methanobrevibacter sp.]
MIFVAMDDTDNINTRGTGRLSRNVAEVLGKKYPIKGIVRHQLLVHPDVPYTSHNSCAVIHIDINVNQKGEFEVYKDNKNLLKEIFEETKKEMLDDFIEGSDPGLAVASDTQVTASLIAFGKDTKEKIVTQCQARSLSKNLGILLEGLGGTEDGIIGAMAGIGLSSTYNDGRYISVGKIRELFGDQSVRTLLKSGIDEVVSIYGESVKKESIVKVGENKSVKPCPINNEVVLLVENIRGELIALKRK